ncbi:MBOAT, membrane-bound O-acyltransferase family-domain-containing protein [Phascolomyces articulosus]|uniref:MBOAT, membrane-bound O-acyltransferase family-domain-containing protein n=1 Tax=Phascolomyces articulosus TaxID=60185 RepID=A0AAD5PJ37_9FUNG|nr:MBOAT, membrane-bound O-acyltransferase family-domain-containing protein [Phascolomyces articulosus]
MDDFFETVAGMLGDQVAADHIKLIACLLATYPLAEVYRRLPADNPTSRHLLSIAYAVFALVFVLQLYVGALHIVITSLFTYYWMRSYRAKNGPGINFVVVLISMSICHIIRQIQGDEGDTKLDYSGVLMMGAIKLSSFGFNVLDGRVGGNTDYNKQMKIDRYPSLIEYFGWLCYFGGLFVGPTCEYMEYYRFTNFFFLSPDKKISPYKPTIRLVLFGVLFASITAFVGPTYNYYRLLENDYLTLPFHKRLLYIYITGFVWRCKFYCVWGLAEGSCVLSQFGYNGIKDGKHRWDRLTNADWIAVETSQSMQNTSTRWNRCTTNWLRHYVYERLSPPSANASGGTKTKKKSSGHALMATYIVSGIWHGYHPGYYVLFCNIGLIQMLGRRVRRAVRPLVMSAEDVTQPLPVWKKAYDIIGNLVTFMLGGILVGSFELLYLSRTLIVWKSIHYIHFWGYLITWIGLSTIEPMLFKMQKRRKEQAEAAKKKKLLGDNTERIVMQLEIK